MRGRVAALTGGIALAAGVAVAPTVSTTSAAFSGREYARTTVHSAQTTSPRPDGCRVGAARILATIYWEPPAQAAGSYTYRWQIVDADGDVIEESSEPQYEYREIVQVIALEPDSRYRFRIRASSGESWSPWRTASIVVGSNALGSAVFESCSWD